MVEIRLKSDPGRPGWFIAENVSTVSPTAGRMREISRGHVWRPPTDVFETDRDLVVRVEIAGMREEDISILLSSRYLLIRGLRQDNPERRAYYQMEIYFGEFITEVELACPVVVNEVAAEYDKGFLRVILPKEAPHKIRVQE